MSNIERFRRVDCQSPPLSVACVADQFFCGIVEVDESYVGGKPRKGKRDQSSDLIVNKRGEGTKMVPVVALVERDGRIHTQVMEVVNASNPALLADRLAAMARTDPAVFARNA
ncbi:MAG: transposase [Thermoguttaceae bacterium]